MSDDNEEEILDLANAIVYEIRLYITASGRTDQSLCNVLKAMALAQRVLFISEMDKR